jgi:hypothetical protein
VDTTAFAGPVFASAAEFRIGNWSHTGSNRAMGGSIQRVGLWNRVLTAPERDAIYNAGSGIDYPFA